MTRAGCFHRSSADHETSRDRDERDPRGVLDGWWKRELEHQRDGREPIIAATERM